MIACARVVATTGHPLRRQALARPLRMVSWPRQTECSDAAECSSPRQSSTRSPRMSRRPGDEGQEADAPDAPLRVCVHRKLDFNAPIQNFKTANIRTGLEQNGKRTKRFSSANGAKTDQTVRVGRVFSCGSTFDTLYYVRMYGSKQSTKRFSSSKRSKNGPNTNPFFRLLQPTQHTNETIMLPGQVVRRRVSAPLAI